MQQQQIQALDPEQTQRVLGRRDDMRAARVVVLDAVLRSHLRQELDAALGDDLDLALQVRSVSECAAEQALARVVDVDVRMVDRRDADLDCRSNQVADSGAIETRLRQPPSAEYEARDTRALCVQVNGSEHVEEVHAAKVPLGLSTSWAESSTRRRPVRASSTAQLSCESPFALRFKSPRELRAAAPDIPPR